MIYPDEQEIIEQAQKRPPEDPHLLFWFIVVVLLPLIAFWAGRVDASVQKHVVAPVDKCLVRLDNREVAKIGIATDGTALDFPTKPAKVILGRKNSFGIEYVETDLAISPLSASARSHLYVYLEGRRFTFELSTVSSGGCAVIAVRDAHDNQVSVEGFFPPKK